MLSCLGKVRWWCVKKKGQLLSEYSRLRSHRWLARSNWGRLSAAYSKSMRVKVGGREDAAETHAAVADEEVATVAVTDACASGRSAPPSQ